MIVGTYFDGDDDMELAWKQHDVYGQALGIVVGTCNRFALFAVALLGDSGHKEWGRIEGCDHRTLQGAHDLLAAAWRFREGSRQGELPLVEDAFLDEARWLDWLRTELSTWIDEPRMVRSVQLILSNQNEPAGYEAETSLCLALLDRFSDVPWKQSLREAHEADGAETRLARSDPGTESNVVWFPAVCACVGQGLPPCNESPCRTWQRTDHQSGAEPLE
ncbi:MAG: hypothetical protein RIC87_06110 [Kiloniellales bacterium]